MPRRTRCRAATCSLLLAPLAAASCCACASAAADAAASAWAVSYPSAANWSLPRPAGTLPRCSFPSADYAAAEPAQQLRTLCVVGERHSGTNFVSALLDLNFAFADDADAAAGDDSRPPLQAHPRLTDPLGRVPPRPGRVGHGCVCVRRCSARELALTRTIFVAAPRTSTLRSPLAAPRLAWHPASRRPTRPPFSPCWSCATRWTGSSLLCLDALPLFRLPLTLRFA